MNRFRQLTKSQSKALPFLDPDKKFHRRLSNGMPTRHTGRESNISPKVNQIAKEISKLLENHTESDTPLNIQIQIPDDSHNPYSLIMTPENNLWGSIKFNIESITPKEILSCQIEFIQQKSRGLLLAEVTTAKNEFSEIHALDVIAPTLHNYRHEILEITNERGKPYPATLEYEVLEGEPGNQELTIVAVELASEEDALREIAKALQSPVTRQVIQGLMKRIRPESVGETQDEALSAS